MYTKPEIKITVLNNKDSVMLISGVGGVNMDNFKSSKSYSSVNF